MNSPFNFPKSKIPVPESPFLSSSRASLKILSELSDQVFFDEVPPVEAPPPPEPIIDPLPPVEEQLEVLPPRVPVPSVAELEFDPAATPTPLIRRKSTRRKKPPDLHLRASSDLVETKLEVKGGQVDPTPVPPLQHKVSKSLENLSDISNEETVPKGKDESPSVPFRKISTRMDRKKSKSVSKLNLNGSNVPEDSSRSPTPKSSSLKRTNGKMSTTSSQRISRNPGVPSDKNMDEVKEKDTKATPKTPTQSVKSKTDPTIAAAADTTKPPSTSTAGKGPPTSTGKAPPTSTASATTGSKALPTSTASTPTGSKVLPTSTASTPTGSKPLPSSTASTPTGSKPLPSSTASTPTGSKAPPTLAGSAVSPSPKVPKNLADSKKVPDTPASKRTVQPEAGKRVKVSSVPLKSETSDHLSVGPGPSGGKKPDRDSSKSPDGRKSPSPRPGKSGDGNAPTDKRKGSLGSGGGGDKKGGGDGGDKKKPAAGSVVHHVVKEVPLTTEGKKEVGPGPEAAGGPLDKEQRNDELEKEKVRELAQRVLVLCQKSDWHGVEQNLRNLEKSYFVGPHEEFKPLAGVFDEESGWTPLMYCVKDNRVQLADRMLELGCDVNAKNKETFTPLHLAALFGRDETVRFLLAKKADTTAITAGKKQTALHLACTRPSGNATNIIKVICGAMPKDARLIKDGDGNIPLFIALTAGTRGACQELLSHLSHEQMRMKAGPRSDTALHLAIRKRDLETARIFVDSGANVDAKNGDGQTPMHIAAAEGDENLLKFFYLCKANPNISDKQDRTPIHIAAQHGHTSVIELLSEKFKVSVFERTKDGSTLMHIASLHGHPDTAMALFRKGVPLQMPNKGGARSLHIAARHGHAAMISKLLEKGEKVDATTNDNYTALHIAVESGRPGVVETLLGYGAQVHIKGGKSQETPLHIAARVNEGDKCAQMLLKSGADPNITMENGETPLHVAARVGRLRIIRLLLNDGANPMFKSKDGETPLHLACRFGHLRVVKELVQYIAKERGETDVEIYLNSATNKGESALHYATKLSEVTSTNRNLHEAAREIAQLLLNGGASVYQQTKDTHETVFHYCAREGNNDILKEMLTRMTPVECQRALNKQSTKGWSPLLIACHKGHIDVVRTLLENNARVDVFDNDGRTALHLAAEHGFQQVCGMLLKHKAFINAKSRTGFTALHLAAMKGYTKLCLFLIQEHNAYVDVVTLKKQTPLHLAAESGQLEVCRLLLGLRGNPDATDEKGQKPIHLAAQHNHGDVIKLFLKSQPSLVSSATKDGSTCAHLAAMQGSVSVLEELMKFDKQGVISARNRSTDATALQLAAEGGHAELVKALLEAGASATDENRAGYAAIHLASKNGHTNVIDSLRNSDTDAISLSSRKLGLTGLHIAAYFGQTETVRELLTYIPATIASDPPISLASSFLKELGTESGLTPLHLASFSGEENVVRLLLNSQGVQVEAPSANLGLNAVHLACRGGHTTIVGLLLSRSSELLESRDNEGKTGLHIAAVYGHQSMVEILLGQGAEIDAVDKENWTPLHCAAKAGHLDVVKLLIESGASPLAKTAKGLYPIWYAAAENHNHVLNYLIKTEHDSYGLMEDRDFVYNLTICGKNNDNEPINDFVLASPAPVDIAAKLSNILASLSTREKERAKDLIGAAKYCESMAAELLALASGPDSAGKLLRSVDRRSIQFLDILIENEQKEVIAHTAVQRYLSELWVGNLTWASWKLLLLFTTFIFCPPVWVIFSLPMGHRFHKIPIIKFMSYLTSHIYLMVLLCLTSITPIYPILRTRLLPYWHEWILLAWLVGLIISEVTNPSDKAGLGWIKVAVLIFSIFAIVVHGIGFFVARSWYGHIFYMRNQFFAVAILLACVQILDFLSFHYLFGPWAIIIGNLMKDLARFLAVLAIFMVGFSMVMASLNQPFFPRTSEFNVTKGSVTSGLPSGVLVTPLDTLELLFFALFGQGDVTTMMIEKAQPPWTSFLFKIFFAIYLLVTVIVLINLLIAMMSDTYQRIQAQSDIEWKFGLAKLIRNMHRTSATPSPINLLTSWIIWIVKQCRKKREPFNPLKWERKGAQVGSSRVPTIFKIGKPTPKQRWKTVLNKTKVTPRVSDIMRLSVAQVSPMTPSSPLHPLGSTMSGLHHQQRIETVADWAMVAKKYRVFVGREEAASPPDYSGPAGGNIDSPEQITQPIAANPMAP